MDYHLRRARHLVAAVALTALTVGCTNHRDDPLRLEEQAVGEVRTALSCAELTETAKAELAHGVATGRIPIDLVERSMASKATPRAPGTVGQVFAGTNVAELGVDEPDIIKTDGRRIVNVADDGVLRVVTLDDVPALDGTMALAGYAGHAELFLRRDEAVVVMQQFGDVVAEDMKSVPPDTPTGSPESEPAAPGGEAAMPDSTTTTVSSEPSPFVEGVTLVRVDLSDPAHPTEMERSIIEGSLVAARMVEDTPRVVVRSTPPIMDDIRAASDTEEAEAVIADIDAGDLLPRRATGDRIEALGDCEDVAVLPASQAPDSREAGGAGPVRPRTSIPAVSAPSTVSVLSVGDTLADLEAVTVEGMADLVYASPTAVYVSSTNWAAKGSTTAIHRFDTAGDGAVTYSGSATVPGLVRDHYSLSEAAGDLRVVTTLDNMEPSGDTPNGGASSGEPADDGIGVITPHDAPDDTVSIDEDPAPPVPTTEGRLTILAPQPGGELVEIGHVDDLGEGETVQSVRFVGDIAYVVTFRQTDPLYAIDLSDPAHPKALGALKVTGFSQYLHPVGDGLLLGLGREADETGADEGLKVSLFDVSDPTAPLELDKIVIPDAWSLAADDPHAFTWDPVARHAIFPIRHFGPRRCDTSGPCAELMAPPGALVVAVNGEDLTEVVELHHSDAGEWESEIMRSVVVDRDLWTLSGLGLGRSNADTPSTVELVTF